MVSVFNFFSWRQHSPWKKFENGNGRSPTTPTTQQLSSQAKK
jgi:hypothetical protein